MVPWRDRSGRVSALKAFTLALLVAPGAWLAIRWMAGDLGPRPLTEAIQFTGLWAVRFLLLSLAVSPARWLLRWSRLIAVRRMIGLAALAYAVAHVSLYVADQQFDAVRVATEIAGRIYLTIGLLALLGLAVLGATSTDGAVRKLGGKAWQRLHRLVYPAAAVALAHFLLQAKADVSQAVLVVGLFAWLMACRWLRSRDGLTASALVTVSVLAAAAAAFGEAGWYGLSSGAPADRVLAANLSLGAGIRPAWWVLMAGLVMTMASLIARTDLPRLPLATVKASTVLAARPSSR